MSAATPIRFVRSLSPRDPHEQHRVSTPLELLTDLCFVVAVAQASLGLHHASGAAIGPGLAVRAEYWSHPEEVPVLASAAAVTVPIAVLMATLWFLQLRQHDPSLRAGLPFAIAIVLVVACTFSEFPELLSGLVVVALLVTELRQVARTSAVPAVLA